jgi:hypothetical protein
MKYLIFDKAIHTDETYMYFLHFVRLIDWCKISNYPHSNNEEEIMYGRLFCKCHPGSI